MNKTKAIWLILIMLLLQACPQAEQEQKVKKSAIPVRTVTVGQLDYLLPVRASGLLNTSAQMKLSFKTGGIIAHVADREGAAVKKGEELARLDLAEIRAQVNQARIAQEKAKRDMDRARNLYRDSVATLEQYQDARSAYELARSGKQIADFNLRHSSIKAPSDGKILKVLAEKNELISAGHPVLLFASSENDWVIRAPLSDKDIVRLEIGDSAGIRMDAFPGMPFRGEVSELATLADPVSGTYEVEIRLIRLHPQFRTGFISRVEIYPGEKRQALAVPVEALLNASEYSATVFLVKNGRALKRKVKTGMILGAEVLIREGLLAGDSVVVDGNSYLRGGEELEIPAGSKSGAEL